MISRGPEFKSTPLGGCLSKHNENTDKGKDIDAEKGRAMTIVDVFYKQR